MEAVLTGELNKTVTVESNRTGSGGALQTTQYLSGTLITAIALVADPNEPRESNAIRIITNVNSLTSLPGVTNEDGVNEVLVVFFENQERFDIKSVEGENAIIQFTAYEKVGGLVEGTYQTKGKVLQTGQIVSLHIRFSVRRVT
jgi:predicted outer membrane repeat protein